MAKSQTDYWISPKNEIVERTRNGLIVRTGTGSSRYFWIDEHLEDWTRDDLPEDVDAYPNRLARSDQVEGVYELEEKTDQVDLIRSLDDRLTPYGFEMDPENYSGVGVYARETRIPVRIAGEGKAVMAAYLVAHGHSQSSVSSALDVAESTISQYVSDFRKGRR
jgi:hypothetical protein